MEHEKFLRAIFDVFDPGLPQLAPGDAANTRRALEILYGPDLGGAKDGLTALDIGCGNGRQSLRLAAELDCPVLATDLNRPYLDELERRAAEQGVGHLIETHCADMAKLDLGGRRFGLVWAEGSAFIMGMREALQAWHEFVEPDGALGYTELTWFEPDVPDECREFMQGEYPPMADEAANLALLDECGWDLVGHFRMSESAWSDSFYEPLAKRMETYVAPDDSPETEAVVGMVRGEISNYRRFGRYYGYTFFLARPRG